MKDQRQAVRIGKGERRRATSCFDFAHSQMVLRQAIGPVVDASQWNGERDFHRQPYAGLRLRHLWPREERDVGSGVTFSVGVKQVIRSGRILIYALLDEAHAEHAGVKVDVVLGVASNASDVVESAYAAHSMVSARWTSGFLRISTYSEVSQIVASFTREKPRSSALISS